MQAAFDEPQSPTRYLDTAQNIRSSLAYEHYGYLSDIG